VSLFANVVINYMIRIKCSLLTVYLTSCMWKKRWYHDW